MGIYSLPGVTNQTGMRPVTGTDGSRALGRQVTQWEPARYTGSGQSHPREVTHVQKTVIVGQGLIGWGWTDSRQRLVKQADRQEKSSEQADGQPDRHTDTQTDRQTARPKAVSRTQGEAGRHLNPEPISHSAERASRSSTGSGCHLCPSACAGLGGRGGCGESSPPAPPTEQLAPPQRQ